MDNKILINNEQALKRNYPEFFGLYSKYMENYELDDSIIVEGNNVAIEYKNRTWMLNSIYNSKEATSIWAEQFDYREGTVFVLFGLGNIDYALELQKRSNKRCYLIIYEPNPSLFVKVMNNIDMTSLMDNGAAIVVESINVSHVYEYLCFIGYANREKVIYCSTPNYEKIFDEKNRWLRSLVVNQICTVQLEKNTEISISQEMFDNYIENLPSLIYNSSLNNLVDAFENVDKKIPAVVVAAGPSLSKNINELKKYKNKAFVIACDSALNPLLKNGIIPDIAVTLDSHKPLDLFAREEVSDMPFLIDLQAVSWLNENHHGKKFYFPSNDLSMGVMKKYGDKMKFIETCGSVANDAFSLAQVLGFKTIVLIGQDLAYADGGKYYANDVHENGKIGNYSGDDRFLIDGYYGDKVYTINNLFMYKTWFEKQIVRYSDLHVINSTEGGAMIYGAENLPLKEALLRECKSDEQDFKSIIESVEDTFDRKEREELVEYYKNCDKTLDFIKKKIKEGIECYRKMQELIAKGKGGNSDYRRMVARTGEIQQLIETEPIMLLAALHNREVEYDVLGEEISGDNEADIARQSIISGIRMLESYLYGIDKALEALPKLRENFDKIGALYS